MASLENYFNKITHKPNWFIGDRVEGKYNKIPFVGTVLVESFLNEDEGPKVSVQVDLPLLYKGIVYNIIYVKPKDLKARK